MATGESDSNRFGKKPLNNDCEQWTLLDSIDEILETFGGAREDMFPTSMREVLKRALEKVRPMVGGGGPVIDSTETGLIPFVTKPKVPKFHLYLHVITDAKSN